MHKDDFCELTRMSPYRVFVTPFGRRRPGFSAPSPTRLVSPPFSTSTVLRAAHTS
jgi:hypothetical protein